VAIRFRWVKRNQLGRFRRKAVKAAVELGDADIRDGPGPAANRSLGLSGRALSDTRRCSRSLSGAVSLARGRVVLARIRGGHDCRRRRRSSLAALQSSAPSVSRFGANARPARQTARASRMPTMPFSVGHANCGPRFSDAPHFWRCNLWIAGLVRYYNQNDCGT